MRCFQRRESDIVDLRSVSLSVISSLAMCRMPDAECKMPKSAAAHANFIKSALIEKEYPMHNLGHCEG